MELTKQQKKELKELIKTGINRGITLQHHSQQIIKELIIKQNNTYPMKLDIKARYLHVITKDGEIYDFPTDNIEYLKMDDKSSFIVDKTKDLLINNSQDNIVKGVIVINGKTYTKTVGGTIGNAVDLGLPSGTLWADHNIGAFKPEDLGAEIAWAETGVVEEGYVNGVKMKNGEQHYNFDNHKYSAYNTIKAVKYVVKAECGIIDNKTELESIDDAATVNWGDEWKTPTIKQLGELFNEKYTILKWSERNGVGGIEVTSKQNGNTIFFPASNGGGSYWSSSLDTIHRRCAWRLRFDPHSYNTMGYCSYYYGDSIRPVRRVIEA